MGYTYAMSEEFLDEEVETGRVLTLEEYVDRLKNTPGIFTAQSTTPVRAIESVCLTSALITGALAISYSPIPDIVTDPDWFDIKMDRVIREVPPEIPRPPTTHTKPQISSERKVIVNKTVNGDNKISGRPAGSPSERIARKGIFAIVAQANISGNDAAFNGITGKGGFATAIDATIQGVNGFKQAGGFSSGRRGISSIGFGTGYGLTGDGDGAGGIDDITGLYDNPGNFQIELKAPVVSVSFSTPLTYGTLTVSGRSKSSVMGVVMQNLAAIRYLYNNRLNQKPGLHGKVTVRFAIDEFGKVLYCDVIESTIGDNDLEKNMIQKIRLWRFDKIDKPGDVTEIVYPFVFSAG